jgi:hypothetical protein
MAVPESGKPVHVCGDCIYWTPYPAYPKLGICSNVASNNYDRACIYSQAPCPDFVLRTLRSEKIPTEEIEFYWCEECKEYFHKDLMERHTAHKIYNKVAHTDVEFNVETTHFAG